MDNYIDFQRRAMSLERHQQATFAATLVTSPQSMAFMTPKPAATMLCSNPGQQSSDSSNDQSDNLGNVNEGSSHNDLDGPVLDQPPAGSSYIVHEAPTNSGHDSQGGSNDPASSSGQAEPGQSGTTKTAGDAGPVRSANAGAQPNRANSAGRSGATRRKSSGTTTPRRSGTGNRPTASGIAPPDDTPLSCASQKMNAGLRMATAIHRSVKSLASDLFSIGRRIRQNIEATPPGAPPLPEAALDTHVLATYDLASGLEELLSQLVIKFFRGHKKLKYAANSALSESEREQSMAQVRIAVKDAKELIQDLGSYVHALSNHLAAAAWQARTVLEATDPRVERLDHMVNRCDSLIPLAVSLANFTFPSLAEEKEIDWENFDPLTWPTTWPTCDPIWYLARVLSKYLKNYRALTCAVVLALTIWATVANWSKMPGAMQLPLVGFNIGILNQLCCVCADTEPVTDTSWLEMWSRFNIVKAFADAVQATKPAATTEKKAETTGADVTQQAVASGTLLMDPRTFQRTRQRSFDPELGINPPLPPHLIPRTQAGRAGASKV